MVNPEFVEREGTQLEDEGCLSLPGFNATVLRPARAVWPWIDRGGPDSAGRRFRPAGARLSARDRSPRRARVRRSAARHQAGRDRAQGAEAAAVREMVTMPPLRIAFSERPTSRCRPSRPDRGSRHEVVATGLPAGPSQGRGHRLQPTPTKQVAAAAGVAVLQPAKHPRRRVLRAVARCARPSGWWPLTGRSCPTALLAIPAWG